MIALLAFLGVAGGGFTQPRQSGATMDATTEFLLLRHEEGRLGNYAPEWAQEGELRAAVRFRKIPTERALHLLLTAIAAVA